MAEGLQVGSIYYDVDLEDSKFRAGASNISTQLDGLKSRFQAAEQGSKIFMATLLGLGTAAFGVAAKSTMTAARTETLGVAMMAVAKATGTSTKVIQEQEAALKKQGITTQEARSTLTKFMQSQLDVADASKIARVAQDLAVIAGENSSQTTARLTNAIATMNPELLRSVGIVKNSAEIFETYATTLGKDADSLTEVEKKQAMVNLILQEGEKVAGTYEAAMDTAGKKLGSMARLFEEAANSIGQFFLPAFGAVIDTVSHFLKQVTPENIQMVLDKLQELAPWFPVIAGAIIGALLPALVAMAIALWNIYWPLVPFVVIGAALGGIIQLLVDQFGGWQVVMTNMQVVIEDVKKKIGELTVVYTENKVQIDNAVAAITIFFIPSLIQMLAHAVITGAGIALHLTANVVKFIAQIVIAAAKNWLFIASLIGKIIQIGIATAVFIVHTAVTVASTVATVALTAATWLLNAAFVILTGPVWILIAVIVALIAIGVLLYKNWDIIKEKGTAALNYLTGQWNRFWSFISGIVDKISKALEKINPFHRESPSLVDNVTRGVSEIIDQYARLADISLPGVAGEGFGSLSGVAGGQVINIYVDKIADGQDIQAIGREIGFVAGLQPR